MKFESFTGKDKFIEVSKAFPNPLDPRTAKKVGYTLLQPEIAAPSGNARDVLFYICIPPKLVEDHKNWLVNVASMDDSGIPYERLPVNLTLFFSAPGDDNAINTLGLKYFFKDLDDTFIIGIPGFEDHGSAGNDPKYAAITTAIINDLVKAAGTKAGSDFFFEITITCLTAYSAGYGGMIQTVNNDLIVFDKVKKMVFYDCLYRTDGPKIPAGESPPQLLPSENNTSPDEVDKSGHSASAAYNTRRAIIRIKNKNKDMLVIAYCVTSGGSPKYTDGSNTYTVVVDKLIDIRASVDNSNFLFALSFTRALITARDEGIINTTDIPVAFINLYNATIPARGQIASSTVQMKLSATGFTPTTTLESWGTLNKTLVDKTLTSFDSVADLIGKKKLFYDGYPSAANSGGMLHIGQILEFAWEEFV